jgi:hypothetical protein
MRLMLSRTREVRFTAFKWVLLIASTVSAVFGQVSYVRPGSFELDPFIGGSYGIVNAQFMGGANLTFAANKYILPYAEFGYFPQVASPSISSIKINILGSPYTSTENISFKDFHGGVHVRLPIHEKPIVPYLAFGMGVLSSPTVTGLVTVTEFNQLVPFLQPAQTSFAVNGGGGLRYYFNQRYGVRIEAKVYKPTGTLNSTFGKVEFGFFYQFR